MIGRSETLSAEIPENVCGKRQGGKGGNGKKLAIRGVDLGGLFIF